MAVERAEAFVPSTGAARRAAPFAMPWWTAPAVTLPALFLRVVSLGAIRNAVEDQSIHALTALVYPREGLLFPDTWWSPPLKHLVMAVSMGLFGNDVIGWRLKNVLFGTLLVYLAFLVARRAFRRPMPAMLTALLLAVDPFSIGLAHATQEDILAVCFMLLGTLLTLRGVDEERDADFLGAGLAFGVALAFRWWAVWNLLAMAGLALWSRRRDPQAAVTAGCAFATLPLVPYVLSYLPWIARGFTLPEWASLQADALALQGSGFSDLPSAFDPLAHPIRWFVSWVGAGGATALQGRATAVSTLMNDPVIWILFVPCAVVLAVLGWRRRRPGWVAIAAAFALTYAFMLASPRTILLYSAMSVVPYGTIAVAFAASHFLKDRALPAGLVAAAWSLYLFPLVSRVPLWLPAYRWLLRAIGA